tara:strand:+ start:1993 stop:2163 length:171 start_codon:yes stop_codon:yes gene_type:complete
MRGRADRAHLSEERLDRGDLLVVAQHKGVWSQRRRDARRDVLVAQQVGGVLARRRR